MNEAFSLGNVKKRYKSFTLDVDDLSLDRGYVMGLVGQNGAGKSTTIKIMMNLIYPDSGDVRILGLHQPEHDIEIKRRVGYISEEPHFYQEMAVGLIIGLVKRYYPKWDAQLCERYMRKFALDPRKKVKELSRGMRVKFGLVLALSHRPELLILDEPTSGIDPVMRQELLEEIGDIIRDEERTVILSSHITQDIERVADYVAVIDQGRVAECADKETLRDRWKKVAGTLQSCQEAADTDLPSLFTDVRRDGMDFVGVTRSFSEDWLERLRSKGAVDIKVMNVSLDEILVSLAGKEN